MMTESDEVQLSIKQIHDELPLITCNSQEEKQLEAKRVLEKLRESFKQAGNRPSFSEILCKDLVDWLSWLHRRVREDEQNQSKHTLDIVAEIFRCLRNACAGCRQSQDIVSRTENCIQISCEVLLSIKDLLPGTQHKELYVGLLTALKCGVQFFGNVVGGHDENQVCVWEIILSRQSRFKDLLNTGDSALGNYTAMVIFSCLSEARCQQLVDEAADTVEGILELFSQHDSEWSWFIIERLLQCPGLLEQLYGKVNDHRRIQLLQVVASHIEQKAAADDIKPSAVLPISYKDLSFVCEEFTKNAHVILSLSQESARCKVEPQLVTSQLSVLCAVSGHCKLRLLLQQVDDILPTVINLLQCLYMIGQEGQNNFTSVTKVSDISDADPRHPTFGLKKDIIRLIGNLAYQHRSNQDKIRELGGLRLVLEHTNIDGRNPFVTQWAVLAVRNLCENNLENKSFIARLNMQGVANNEELQQQFGITADVRNGSVIIRPEDR